MEDLNMSPCKITALSSDLPHHTPNIRMRFEVKCSEFHHRMRCRRGGEVGQCNGRSKVIACMHACMKTMSVCETRHIYRHCEI